MTWAPMRSSDMRSQREISRVPWGAEIYESETRRDDGRSAVPQATRWLSVFVVVGWRLKIF